MDKKETPLHMVLAVLPDLKKKTTLIIEEGITTLTKKADHFDGVQKSFVSLQEGRVESPAETKNMVTTVAEKIKYVEQSIINCIDATVTMEETNGSGKATAPLEVSGVNFGTFSATTLLALEKQLERIRDLYKSIPTLDPTKTWSKDESASMPGTFKSTAEEKFHTAKIQKPIVMYEATKEFPAQVQMTTYDEKVEKSITIYFSGKITPAQKSQILGRIDTLIAAVKVARAQANMVPIVDTKVGQKLFAFIDGNTF